MSEQWIVGNRESTSVSQRWITIGREHYDGLLALIEELRRQLALAQMLEQSEANCERYHDEVVRLRTLTPTGSGLTDGLPGTPED